MKAGRGFIPVLLIGPLFAPSCCRGVPSDSFSTKGVLESVEDEVALELVLPRLVRFEMARDVWGLTFGGAVSVGRFLFEERVLGAPLTVLDVFGFSVSDELCFLLAVRC